MGVMTCVMLPGEIPDRITSLHTLTEINLSSNQLRGEIPPKVYKGAKTKISFLFFFERSISPSLTCLRICFLALCQNEAGVETDRIRMESDLNATLYYILIQI